MGTRDASFATQLHRFVGVQEYCCRVSSVRDVAEVVALHRKLLTCAPGSSLYYLPHCLLHSVKVSGVHYIS